jgi:pyridoxamine 5'-phosphate oxidase family protein
MFSHAELDFLDDHDLARMATVQPDGTLQVSPVGYRHNREAGSIDVAGMKLARSRKFRNVENNGRVAIVIDDRPSLEPMRVRCLEIRGRAEALLDVFPEDGHLDGAMIRIRPQRIISIGIDDPEHGPEELVPHNRDVAGTRHSR